MKAILKHWTKGGTALTNFPETDRAVYEEAALRFGDPRLSVERERMEAPVGDSDGGSLHVLTFNSAERVEVAQGFWPVFYHVQNELRGAPIPDYYLGSLPAEGNTSA